MNHLRDAAIVASLVNELNVRESFCGETHIQKATYLLKEMLEVPLSFSFSLYLYGPYSFDLHGELESYRADEFLKMVPRLMGASWIPASRYDLLARRFSKTIRRTRPKLEFVADRIAKLDVKALESHATAFYVTQKDPGGLVEARAIALKKIKKHVDREVAAEAVRTIDQWIDEALSLSVDSD